MIIKEFLSCENSISRTETNRIASAALKEVFDSADKDFRSIVINADSRNSVISHYVYQFKVKPLTKWKMKLKLVQDVDDKDNGGRFVSFLP